MRGITLGVCGGLIAATCGAFAFAQTRPGAAQEMLGGMVLRLPAPADKSVAWPAANMRAGFREMVDRKLESQRVLEGGSFNFNLRRETAPEEGATAHGKKADLYLIQSGEATLTTDGELINPKPPAATRRRQGRQRHPQRDVAGRQGGRHHLHSGRGAAPDHRGERRGPVPPVPLGHQVIIRDL